MDDDSISHYLAFVRSYARMAHRRELAASRARTDLYGAIHAALDAGVTTRQLARATGLTQPRIVQIGKAR